MDYSEEAQNRLLQISDLQQAAYFCSGYLTGLRKEVYENDVQKEASAGLEELCFYNEGFALGGKEAAQQKEKE